jgi:hypothetical protein
MGRLRRTLIGEPEMPADEVVAQLETQMKERDRVTDAEALDPTFALRELQRRLCLPIEDQRAPIGHEKLRGKLQ